nr:MAG TPA: hypothetical protein [Inoviridae sp.]
MHIFNLSNLTFIVIFEDNKIFFGKLFSEF